MKLRRSNDQDKTPKLCTWLLDFVILFGSLGSHAKLTFSIATANLFDYSIGKKITYWAAYKLLV